MTAINWGDLVRVKATAPAAMRPGEIAEVVGLREVEDEHQSVEFGVPVGERICQIEFGDGSDMEIAAIWVEACELPA